MGARPAAQAAVRPLSAGAAWLCLPNPPAGGLYGEAPSRMRYPMPPATVQSVLGRTSSKLFLPPSGIPSLRGVGMRRFSHFGDGMSDGSGLLEIARGELAPGATRKVSWRHSPPAGSTGAGWQERLAPAPGFERRQDRLARPAYGLAVAAEAAGRPAGRQARAPVKLRKVPESFCSNFDQARSRSARL